MYQCGGILFVDLRVVISLGWLYCLWTFGFSV